jgi:hypothetical protein
MLGVLLYAGGLTRATTWTTLDYPGASATYITEISGSKIVGYANGHGIIYDMTLHSWATLDVHGAQSTEIDAIDGSNYAGKYHDASGDHGFLYDGTNWTTFKVPGDRLHIGGISGTTITVDYRTILSGHPSFLYDGTTWTQIVSPAGSSISNINGIDGNRIVGYGDFSGWQGFLYDGATWTMLNVLNMGGTVPMDIDGTNIVGFYNDPSYNYYGFLYDGTKWTTFGMPGEPRTFVTGIEGNTLVGYYMDAANSYHGFIYTIPEPATTFLLGFGMMLARKKLSK